MGLTSWTHAPDGKVLITDVVVAKNYLNKDELESLGRIVQDRLFESDFDKAIKTLTNQTEEH